MEYTVSSLKEAIDITIEHIGYDKEDISIIRKLIYKAIEKDSKPFTRTAGAREYIKKSLEINGIILELKEQSETISNDINEIVENYINKYFIKNKNTYEEIKEQIKEKTNIEKIEKKLKYINTSSFDDQEYLTNRWNNFINIFEGKDSTISSEELKYDMIYSALEQSDIYRDCATVLKQIDPMSNNLTKMDALKIVEENIFNNKQNELIELIDRNPILSGLLLQNLFEYIEETKKNEFSLSLLDQELEKTFDLKARSNILLRVLNGEKIENLNKEEVIINLLKNTLSLNIYTNNKKYMDYEERKLYTGNIDNVEEEVIHKRIEENNKIANNLIINGKNTSFQYLFDFINNLSDKEKYFLSNIYVISRSRKENKNKLDNALYYGTNEQIYIYGLLEEEDLLNLLKEKQNNLSY